MSTPVKLSLAGSGLSFEFDCLKGSFESSVTPVRSPISLAEKIPIGGPPMPAPAGMAPTAAELQARSRKAPPPAPPAAPPTLPVSKPARHLEAGPPKFDAGSSEGELSSGKRTPSTKSSEHAPVELSLADMIGGPSKSEAAEEWSLQDAPAWLSPMSANAAIFVPASQQDADVNKGETEISFDSPSFVESRAHMLLVRQCLLAVDDKCKTNGKPSASYKTSQLETASSCSTASVSAEGDSNEGAPSCATPEEPLQA